MKRYMFFVLLIYLMLSNGYSEEWHPTFGQGEIVFSEQDLVIEVEIAESQMQRTAGLMFRKELALNKGMLFIFEQETRHQVWMKNTFIPLDIVFVSAQGTIVSIIKYLQPCNKEFCEIYDSIEPAKYMLEVNAGVIDSNDIKIGQILLIKE